MSRNPPPIPLVDTVEGYRAKASRIMDEMNRETAKYDDAMRRDLGNAVTGYYDADIWALKQDYRRKMAVLEAQHKRLFDQNGGVFW